MLRNFLLRWAANGLGLWIAASLVPGIGYGDRIEVIIIAALIFSVVNALVKPIIVLLSLPAIVVTLGLFMLVINTFMLYLVALIYRPFSLDTFGAALLAVVIVWLVNYTFSTLTQKETA